jgi:hypothetical protein
MILLIFLPLSQLPDRPLLVLVLVLVLLDLPLRDFLQLIIVLFYSLGGDTTAL